MLLARPAAPFDLLGVSPAPMMIVVGIVIWSWRSSSGRIEQAADGKTPLLALEVVDSPTEWAAVVALFIIVGMEGAINFSVPLYIQIVQGRSSLADLDRDDALHADGVLHRDPDRPAVRPFHPAQHRPLRLRAGGRRDRCGWPSSSSNDWSMSPVIAGLITVGLGQGALVTLLFNVLVTSSPKELAGDVGSLRGVTQNLAAAVGTAVIGALVVGILSR